jgi:hypothetical protein
MKRYGWMLLGSLVAACGGEEADPAAEICAAVSQAGTMITATATRSMAPTIAAAETPYTVTLPAMQRSYVKIVNSGDTAYLLATKTANVIDKLYFEGAEEALAAPAALSECPADVPEHFDLDLEMAGSYELELAPSATSELWLMLVLAGEHAD